MSDKWVALLRGVNVGGANRVPMEELRALAEGLGWKDVKSYIASGNLVFEANAGDLAEDLRAAMNAQLSVDVAVHVFPAHEILDAEDACPWDVKGNQVHAFFCLDSPVLDETLRTTLIAEDEELVVQGKRVWLYAPSGVARSKLMPKLERVLGVQATARNLNTVRKLAQMVR